MTHDGVASLTEEEASETDVFVEMINAFRELQHTLCVVAPPPATALELTAAIKTLTGRLKEFAAPEGHRPARNLGMRGIGHPVLVPYRAHDLPDNRLAGSVTFDHAHMGGHQTVHGGVITMLFDDFLGTFVSRKGQPGSRTAFLHVNYRSVTPIRRELRLEANIYRIEGRKTFVTGTLSHDGVVCADAEALFVRLLPGQP
jgi:acyl-coenzyme A thioesterase PaaI-like protein